LDYVGDLPAAYIDIENAGNATEALTAYCFVMEDWVEHVLNNKSTEECYPVNAEPTIKHAEMLQRRINFIRNEFIENL
jgi:hypothetical protein